jgi:hypothetical protein
MKPPGGLTRPAQALQEWIGGRMTLFFFQDFIANLASWYLSEMRVSGQVRVIESSLAIATEIYAVAGLGGGAITKKEPGLLRQKADRISDTWGLSRVHLVNEKPLLRTRAVRARVLHGFPGETFTNVLAALDTDFSAHPTESVVVMLDAQTAEIQE